MPHLCQHHSFYASILILIFRLDFPSHYNFNILLQYTRFIRSFPCINKINVFTLCVYMYNRWQVHMENTHTFALHEMNIYGNLLFVDILLLLYWGWTLRWFRHSADKRVYHTHKCNFTRFVTYFTLFRWLCGMTNM